MSIYTACPPLLCHFIFTTEDGDSGYNALQVCSVDFYFIKTMSRQRDLSFLASEIGKLLESRHIRYHKKNLINASQYRFSISKSILSNLLSFYRIVYEATDRDERNLLLNVY